MLHIKNTILLIVLFTLSLSTISSANTNIIFEEIVEDIAGNKNNISTRGNQLNNLEGISNALNIDYATYLESATYSNRQQPTIQELKSVIDQATAAILVPIYGILLDNTAPTITGIPKTSTNVYDIYQFLPKVNDTNNDTLVFSIQNKPSWAEFNTTTGLLQGTAFSSDEGNYTNIIISVSDGKESVSLDAFYIEVGAAINIAHKYGKATQPPKDGYRYYKEPARAIDGDLSTRNHTQCSAPNNWLQIELPAKTKVHKVVVHNISGQNARLNGSTVYLSNNNYTGTEEVNVSNSLLTLNSNMIQTIEPLSINESQYLLIKGNPIGTNSCLHLSEVEVYGQTAKEPVFITTNQAITIDKWQNKVEAIFDVEAIDYQDETLIYKLSEGVPFAIDNEGHIRVNSTLDNTSYTFDIIISDGINEVHQSLTVSIVENAIVNEMYRTNDNQPALSGFLPNIYNDGDTLSVDINGTNYGVSVDANGRWILDDDSISPALEIGEYNLTLNVNASSIVYENYFEVYGERMQSSKHTLIMNTIANVDVTVNSSSVTPLLKNEKVRGTSIRLYVEDNITKLQNKSYREIASLLASYKDENNNTIVVKLNFSENLKPYSDNNLSSFANDANMSIVSTANHFNMKISFGGTDCNADTNTSKVQYCVPTSSINQETYSSRSTGNNEQAVYSTAIATYNHLYNSIDGLKAMRAWVEKSTYKSMDFTGNSQSINNYIGNEEKMSYLYRNFIETTMPNHHVEMRSMRYKYAAEGMGGGTSAFLFGHSTSNGWASLWEGSIKFDGNRLLTYDTVHHEMMHGMGRSHGTGMTYGWSYALRQAVSTLYTVGENPVVHVPKYIFTKKRKANNQIQLSLYKTTDALEDEVSFEILSSTPLINNDIMIQKSVNDEANQLTLSADETLISRLFLRLYANDSQEVMSDILTPADMIQTELVENNGSNTSYHVISNADWIKSAEVIGTTLEPRKAPGICSAWFGQDAWIAYETDADKINSDFRTAVDNSDWLNSKRFLGRINAWWKYNTYDYSDDGYSKTWTTYNEVVTDDTLGILCVKPKVTD